MASDQLIMNVHGVTVDGQARAHIGNHIGDINNHNYYNGSDPKNKILDVLFLTNSTDDRSALITDKGQRVEGTCEWLTRLPTYIAWKHSPKSQLLWISGGPGKGKTMLSIYLTQELEKSTKSVNAAFLYFFCVSRDQKRNSAVAILRSLLYQLLSQRPQLSKYALKDFDGLKQTETTISSLEALWRIFLSMLQETVLTSVTCLLDGLDECETGLEPFLKLLYRHFSSAGDETSAGELKLLVVSRNKPVCIESWLCTFYRIRLDPDLETEVESDIDRYISFKIRELAIEDRLLPDYLETVAKFLRDRANGTFLWVGFVANELKGKNKIEVEDVLRDVPRGLDKIYQRMIQQVKPERKDIVVLILQWVSAAQRPLTLCELAEAIRTSQQETKDLLEFCGQLLLPLKDDKEVNLVHQSLKDYLQKNELYNAHGHLVVARTCLNYIQRPFSSKMIRFVGNWMERRIELPIGFEGYHLLEYATIYWPLHSKHASDDIKSMFDLSGPFFAKKSLIRENWFRCYWTYMECDDDDNDAPTSFTLMHLAAHCGIISLAHRLFERRREKYRLLFRTPRDKRDSLGYTPLLWAATEGHETVVELLIQKGADANVQAEDGTTALTAASSGGHEAIVKLLLEHGADVNTRDESYGTALNAALEYGNEATARLLLEHGADVNARDEFYGTALTKASSGGHEATVKLLLEQGADVNAQGGHYGTALIAASNGGHEAIVKLLIEHGADMNAQGRHYGTALNAASNGGHEATVKLLFKNRARKPF